MHDIILTMLTTALGVSAIIALGVNGLGLAAAAGALLIVLIGAVALGQTMAGLLGQLEHDHHGTLNAAATDQVASSGLLPLPATG